MPYLYKNMRLLRLLLIYKVYRLGGISNIYLIRFSSWLSEKLKKYQYYFAILIYIFFN